MTYPEFEKKICSLKKIDTHEHYPAEKFIVNSNVDFFDLFVPYICDNLLTAGMTTQQWVMMTDKRISFDERWAIFEPFIDDIKYTTYFKALWATFRDCYTMDAVTKEEALRVAGLLTEENKPGLYAKMNGRNNIEAALSFTPWNTTEYGEGENLYPVPTVSDVSIRSIADVRRLSEYTKVPIYSMDTLLASIRVLMNIYADKGYKAIKFGSAYRRKLDFDAVTAQDAEKVLNIIFTEKVNGDSRMCASPTALLTLEQAKPLDDYLTNYFAGLAGELGLAVFFHAGIHAWNENSIDAIHVSYLEPLIRRHPSTTFILLHCGMPFIDDAIMLAKYYSNVHLNMTWCHIIDRAQSVLCVKKFIELLPISKISGFGGDYTTPQQVYGHLKFACENIASALWEFIETNEMSEEEAITIARKWFYDNPKRLLKI